MGSSTIETGSLTTLHWVGIALAVVTGSIHLALGVASPTTPIGFSSILAGLGFFGAVALLLLNVRRRLLYLAGIPYTAAQIVLYILLTPDVLSPTGLLDKAVQVGLIVVLVVLFQRSQETSSA